MQCSESSRFSTRRLNEWEPVPPRLDPAVARFHSRDMAEGNRSRQQRRVSMEAWHLFPTRPRILQDGTRRDEAGPSQRTTILKRARTVAQVLRLGPRAPAVVMGPLPIGVRQIFLENLT